MNGELLGKIYCLGFCPIMLIFLICKQVKFKKVQKEEQNEDHRRNEKAQGY
jgi:hypothetical protein